MKTSEKTLMLLCSPLIQPAQPEHEVSTHQEMLQHVSALSESQTVCINGLLCHQWLLVVIKFVFLLFRLMAGGIS